MYIYIYIYIYACVLLPFHSATCHHTVKLMWLPFCCASLTLCHQPCCHLSAVLYVPNVENGPCFAVLSSLLCYSCVVRSVPISHSIFIRNGQSYHIWACEFGWKNAQAAVSSDSVIVDAPCKVAACLMQSYFLIITGLHTKAEVTKSVVQQI